MLPWFCLWFCLTVIGWYVAPIAKHSAAIFSVAVCGIFWAIMEILQKIA